MGLDQFTIEFDNPDESYFPGQNVTGKVVVICNSNKIVLGLKIKFVGRAHVYWSEGSGDTATDYSDSETYFDHKFYAVGDGRNDVTIPDGRNEYSFQFALPQGLPSSFTGKEGIIIYEVQAVMKRSWAFDPDVKRQFTVIGIADLNLNDVLDACGPAELKKTKNVCCLCCASGPVGFILKFKRTGYVPGEFVEIECELLNQSSRNVTGVTLSLVQKTIYYAKGKSTYDTKYLSEIKGPGVEPGDTNIWRGNTLQIPSVPPCLLGTCRIIDVQYRLHLEMAISGPVGNLGGCLPITIGTIPFRNDFNEIMPQ